MSNIGLSHAYWQENGMFGTFSLSGNWFPHGRANSAAEAKESAEALALQWGLEAKEFRLRPRAARPGFESGLESVDEYERLRAVEREYERRKAIVCRLMPEAPLTDDKPKIELDADMRAIPDGGGWLVDQLVSSRYAARFVLRVSAAAAQAHRQRIARGDRRHVFVVCEYRGQGIAMTVDEAYERGLREAGSWCPALRA